jgi:hypothetical protein
MIGGDPHNLVDPFTKLFPVQLTGSVSTTFSGTWTYDWEEQTFTPSGGFTTLPNCRFGSKVSGPFLVELNNQNVCSGSASPFAWARLRGMVLGQPYYEVYAGSVSSGGSSFALTVADTDGDSVKFTSSGSITFNGQVVSTAAGQATVGAAASSGDVQVNRGGAMYGDNSFTYSGGIVFVGPSSGAEYYTEIGQGGIAVQFPQSETFALIGTPAIDGASGAAAIFQGGKQSGGVACFLKLCDNAAGSGESIGYAVDAQVGGINANTFNGYYVGGVPGATGSFVAGSTTVTVTNGLITGIS